MADTALVKSDDAIFRVMDHLDEEAYLDEVKGRVVDSWVYHFHDGTKELWGLSKVGIDEASSELAKAGEVIRELDLQILTDPDPDYERYVVKAGRFAVKYNAQTEQSHEVLLETVFGTKRQGKFTMTRGGKVSANTFYFEQGAMKAARNARARLIPATVKAKIIAFAKEKGKVRDIRKDEVDVPSGNGERDQDVKPQVPVVVTIPKWKAGTAPETFTRHAGKPITDIPDADLCTIMEGLRIDPTVPSKAKKAKYADLLLALENELDRRIQAQRANEEQPSLV